MALMVLELLHYDEVEWRNGDILSGGGAGGDLRSCGGFECARKKRKRRIWIVNVWPIAESSLCWSRPAEMT